MDEQNKAPASSRHHYLPQFYIKGFKSPDGHYYVYDKVQGRVKRYSSSESIFFEWHRNTFEEGGKKYTIIEDAYSKTDNLCAPTIANLREAQLNGIFSNDNLAGLTAFVINLFWRVPKSDAVWEEFYKKADIIIVDESGKEIRDFDFMNQYKTSATMKMGHRAFMITDTIRKIRTLEDMIINNKLMSSPLDKRGAFLLGDYPLIYAQEPTSMEGVTREEFFLPISAYRVYFTASRCDSNLNVGKVLAINSLMIDQAVRYVCGPDKEYLELCLQHHDLMQKLGFMPLLRHLLFSGNENIDDLLRSIG